MKFHIVFEHLSNMYTCNLRVNVSFPKKEKKKITLCLRHTQTKASSSDREFLLCGNDPSLYQSVLTSVDTLPSHIGSLFHQVIQRSKTSTTYARQSK